MTYQADTLIDSRAARTRVWALRAQGWTDAALVDAMGGRADVLPALLTAPQPGRERVTVAVDRVIREVYVTIGDRLGGSPVEAQLAKRAGYHRAIFYDEDMNLIEEAFPSPKANKAAQDQNRSRNRLCAARLLVVDDMAPIEIVDRLSCSERVLVEVRRALALPTARDPRRETRVKELIDVVTDATSDIDHTSAIDVLDARDIDYLVRWEALVAAVAPCAVDEAESEAA